MRRGNGARARVFAEAERATAEPSLSEAFGSLRVVRRGVTAEQSEGLRRSRLVADARRGLRRSRL